jgi:preprotein translocase subunit Sec61beta
MSKDNKISLPSGQGGLTRYFEESNSKIELPPAAIVILALVIIIIIIILHTFGGNWFQ